MRVIYYVLFSSLLHGLFSQAVSAMNLPELIDLAYKNSPSIAASRSMAEAEDSLVSAKATLEDPMLGISTLDRNMRTQYGTITQRVRFPVKYYLQAKIQQSRAESFKARLAVEQLEVRSQVTTIFFAIYSAQKIIQLTQANMQAVKEFARIAEKKYAAGKSPQGDSMKAHFELTQLELDLIRQTQEEEALQDSLRAVIGDATLARLELADQNITPPRVSSSGIASSLAALTSELHDKSPVIQSEVHLLKEAEYLGSLYKWEYAPDLQIQYQQRIAGDPEDSKIYSVGITIPLWFWKKSSEASAASAKKLSQEFKVTDATQKLAAAVKDLNGKVMTGSKTLNIYETSLIPQAQSAYKSARSAYQASRTSFLDLLDSERSLYRVRTGFFQSLRQYVSQLSQLEARLGYSVSDLANKIEGQ